jgi:hypothetical protein
MVASEPSLGIAGFDAILIDAKCRSGQSGSPVVYLVTPHDSVLLADGEVAVHAVTGHCLVGLYVGRTSAESDLGLVWGFRAILQVARGEVMNRQL